MAGFKFNYDEGWYTEQGAKSLSEKELRKEYTRMRDVAQKRIGRLSQEYSESKAYSEHRKGFRKLAEIDSRDLPKAFSEIAKFVRAKTSTVSGQRAAQAKTTSTLNKAVGAGSDKGDGSVQAGVTKENYWRTIKILNRVRKLKLAKIYGSDKIVELAETTLGLDNDQFDKVLDKLELFLDATEEGTLKSDIEVYMAENDIKAYQRIDMNDFMSKMGYSE